MLELLTLTSLTKPERNWIMEKTTTLKKKSGYHHGDLRAQLVEATRLLVEEKGPEGFSVTQACRAAGVSTAAPYRHFKDKEEMLSAVVVEGMERHFEAMMTALAGIPDGSIDRISALGRLYVEFAIKEPGVFRLIFGSKWDPCYKEHMMEHTPNTFGVVQQEVAAYLGKTEIDEDVRKRAFMLWTFVHGFSFLWIDEKVSIAELDVQIAPFMREVAERVLA